MPTSELATSTPIVPTTIRWIHCLAASADFVSTAVIFQMNANMNASAPIEPAWHQVQTLRGGGQQRHVFRATVEQPCRALAHLLDHQRRIARGHHIRHLAQKTAHRLHMRPRQRSTRTVVEVNPAPREREFTCTNGIDVQNFK